MNVDLELYRIFYTVAKYKNISKATKELYISQPAITQRINNLEGQLNVRLFNRSTAGMELTDAGKKLYGYVKDSIETMNEVENKFQNYLQESKNKNIKIKSTNLADNQLVGDAIVKFSEKYPTIGIDIGTETQENAIKQLLNGQVDMITINDSKRIKSNQLETIAIKTLSLCLYTSQVYLDKNNGKIDINKNAEKYNFILPKKDSIEHTEFDKFCKKHNLNIQSKYETESINIRNYFAMHGLGIAVGFKEYIEAELKNKLLIEIQLKEKLPQCNIRWVTLKKKEERKEIEEFIKIVKAI